jgi:tetratricopeptide (TPR) repeat protein
MNNTGRIQPDLEHLFSLFKKYNDGQWTRERFIINKQIIELYTNAELERKKILYLTFIVERFPTDPFNAYYLAVAAEAYQKLNTPLLAKYYYEKIIAYFPDLIFGDAYIHKYCLEQLSKLSTRPEDKIVYYRELVKRFEQSIDRGEACFSLARSYEEVGEYARAEAMYKEFLRSPATTIPGFPNAYTQVKDKLKMYESKPTWIMQDLNALVAKVRQAINEKDVKTLGSCRAKDYFFTLTWEQKNDEALAVFTDVSMTDYIDTFLLNSDVSVAAKLDVDSSAKEAFLRTDNWSFQIHPTWYFYFRRVEFGPDPDINGGWEWAGIYFGEKL